MPSRSKPSGCAFGASTLFEHSSTKHCFRPFAYHAITALLCTRQTVMQEAQAPHHYPKQFPVTLHSPGKLCLKLRLKHLQAGKATLLTPGRLLLITQL